MYRSAVRIERPPPAGRLICIGRVVGALLAYGRRLSPPSRRFPAAPIPPESPATLFPCARRPCSADCANAQPSGVRASGGRARPAALFVCAGYPHTGAFPPLRGSLRSPLRKRLPSPLWASLRSAHATQARVRGICIGCLMHSVPARRGGKPCGMSVLIILCLAAFARLGTTGRGHAMPKKGRTCVLCCLAVIIPLRFAKYGRVDRLRIAYSSQCQYEDRYRQAVHELLRA